mmetsp:Transcript_15231/g.38473  ORF Transcript_15231/g.38473 Transcript_15231/m.38473 type:complete len:205 (-) Transcript_15231:127-741(-)
MRKEGVHFARSASRSIASRAPEAAAALEVVDKISRDSTDTTWCISEGGVWEGVAVALPLASAPLPATASAAAAVGSTAVAGVVSAWLRSASAPPPSSPPPDGDTESTAPPPSGMVLAVSSAGAPSSAAFFSPPPASGASAAFVVSSPPPNAASTADSPAALGVAGVFFSSVSAAVAARNSRMCTKSITRNSASFAYARSAFACT